MRAVNSPAHVQSDTNKNPNVITMIDTKITTTDPMTLFYYFSQLAKSAGVKSFFTTTMVPFESFARHHPSITSWSLRRRPKTAGFTVHTSFTSIASSHFTPASQQTALTNIQTRPGWPSLGGGHLWRAQLRAQRRERKHQPARGLARSRRARKLADRIDRYTPDPSTPLPGFSLDPKHPHSLVEVAEPKPLPPLLSPRHP